MFEKFTRDDMAFKNRKEFEEYDLLSMEKESIKDKKYIAEIFVELLKFSGRSFYNLSRVYPYKELKTVNGRLYTFTDESSIFILDPLAPVEKNGYVEMGTFRYGCINLPNYEYVKDLFEEIPCENQSIITLKKRVSILKILYQLKKRLLLKIKSILRKL